MVTIGSELPPGTLIDRRYQIKRILGRGGFGRTYLASDKRRFGELCVLKEFVPKNQGDSVVAQKLHELFQREAQTLHQLNHPQIPKFFAVFEENDRLFIAQEYIDGKTYWKLLQERQRRGTAFSETEVFHWLRHLLPVLDYLHRQNIVHRDISPDNIMLPRKGRAPVLIDFGVVKQAAPHWYEVSTINPDGSVEASVSVGKLGYAPYEQIRIGQCSPRSDLYALAVTAVVMLTAKPPNALIDPKSLEWKWPSLVKMHPRLVKILQRMMSEKPQDRYPSARSVAEDLDSLNQYFGIKSSDRLSTRLQGDSPHTVPVAALTPAPSSTRATLKTPKNTALFPLSAARADRFSTLEATVLEVAHSSTQASRTTAKTSRRSSQSLATIGDRQPTIRTQKQDTTLVLPVSVPGTVRPLADIPATNLNFLVRNSAKFSRSKALLLGLLTLVPLAGMVVGIRSPYISALCQSLNNCVDEQPLLTYRQATQQAKSAKALSQQARTLADLEKAHDRLSKAIDQLTTIPPSHQFFPTTQQDLSVYRETLQRLEQRVEKETRSAQLLQRAEAESKLAAQQTQTAETLQQFTAARSQWRKALATLSAISASTFVAEQAADRSQHYATQLQRVEQRLMAINPTTVADTVITASAKPEVLLPAFPETTPAASPQITPASSAQPSAPATPRIIAIKPQPGGRATTPERSIAAPADQPSVSQPPLPAVSGEQVPVNRTPTTVSALPVDSANTPPQSTENRFLSSQVSSPVTSLSSTASNVAISPGNVGLIASQTLNNVSIRLNGARVSSRGTFVANLHVENQSDRPFGFVPLFVEVRDASGQAVSARLRLSNGSEDGMIDPGERLQGEVYLLDRSWNSSGNQNLTLVIREGTSGNRNFHVTF